MPLTALILAFQDFPRSTIFQDILGNLGDFGRFWKVFLEDRGFWKSWKPKQSLNPKVWKILEGFWKILDFFLEILGIVRFLKFSWKILESFLEDFGCFSKILEDFGMFFLEIFGIHNCRIKK